MPNSPKNPSLKIINALCIIIFNLFVSEITMRCKYDIERTMPNLTISTTYPLIPLIGEKLNFFFNLEILHRRADNEYILFYREAALLNL